jgi:muramoyltetrapeptide carboxypeptidase
LKPGDTIGIVAPAGPFDQDTFDRGTGIIKDLGYEIYVPQGLLEARGFLSGSDEHRAHFINQLFADKDIKAVICARGGYGSIRVLPLLDYPEIAENPKIFIGFSDISALLSVLADRCRLVAFHGPVVTSLADSTTDTVNSLVQAISSDTRLEIRAAGGVIINPGSNSGIVCGGNLATLCHLVGTPYAPDFTDKVLFLEDRAEAPYKIDRMLSQMKLAGCFESLAGIALGSFEACGSIDEVHSIFAETFRDRTFPILGGLDVGHGKKNLTVPFGIDATLDADGHSLSFHRAATAGPEDSSQMTENR